MLQAATTDLFNPYVAHNSECLNILLSLESNPLKVSYSQLADSNFFLATLPLMG